MSEGIIWCGICLENINVQGIVVGNFWGVEGWLTERHMDRQL